MKITKNQILFDKGKQKDEAEIINDIRDELEILFKPELRKGKTLFFKDWDIKQGYINYEIV